MQGDANSGSDAHSHIHWSGPAENEKFQAWRTARLRDLLREFKGGDDRSNLLQNSLVAWGMEHGDEGGFFKC